MVESPTGLRTAERSSTITKCPSLPAEIWRLIFSVGNFDIHGDFWSTYDHPTMASICRSCTLFRDLVRPRLYCNFHSHLLTDEWHCFSVAKFARTICTNPRLASMVRMVDIYGVCDMFSEPWVTSTDNPNHPMAPVLTSKAAELGMGFEYFEVYTHSHHGNVGFDLVALVLAKLPMMHTLHLYWLDATTAARMPQPRGGWPWTQSLRKMILKLCTNSADPTTYEFRLARSFPMRTSLSRVLPLLFGGASLTRLSLFDSPGPNVALPLDNLREAILIDYYFHPGQLNNLLQRCTRLRKFVYSAAEPTNPDIPGRSEPRKVIEALEPAHSSLEVLGIDLRRIPGTLSRGRITSLQQFVALKTLYIDSTCIWDWQASKESPPSPDMLFTTLLPESIKEVALFGMTIDGQTRKFEPETHVKRLALERKEKGRFPQLKRFRGQEFWPFGYDLDERSVIICDVMRRINTLDEAKLLLGDDGVEVIFDEEDDSDLEFSNIISHH